jgi:hypothetical protein
MDPDLVRLADGRKLPHVYSEDPVELCLFRPRYFEWDESVPLDRTIVPWIYLWLFYFEEWLISDQWKGGGEHPEPHHPIVSVQRLRSPRKKSVPQDRDRAIRS